MAPGLKAILLSFLLQCMLFQKRGRADPVPTPWPLQFHALIYTNTSGSLAFDDLWYDWPNGRNFNIIHNQLGSTLHDLEWTNGTSFYYDLELKTCKPKTFPVGILRPNWLQPATYLGVESMDGFTCNVWSKADNFIFYYEDVETKRPVHWLFFTGMSMHVMTFEVGKVLEDKEWQAPAYCFGQSEDAMSPKIMAETDQLLPEQRWLQSLVSLL